MVTQQAQIKLNLPLALKEYLESKAAKFGVPMASYIKHLILKDVADMDQPTFEASDRTIKAYNQAMKDKKADKLIKVKDIDKFFDSLQ